MHGIANLYLTAYDNDGGSTERTRAFCERKLILAYGGCTSYQGLGSWLNPKGKIIEETVIKYEIAAEWTNERRDILRKVARAFCIDASQECVLVVFPDAIEYIDSKWIPT